ncbi:MAG TPA: peptidoglycan editing factor PgeF [Actinomycetota bacterium]|nr:peptidoglycan editing factor PgeF [Actinomycetota bacterium]
MLDNQVMNLDPSLDHITSEGVDLLVDSAAREQGVVIAFSSRIGGVSPAPFESLNLSWREGDSPDSVTENRRRLTRAVGLSPDSLVLARQVHGADVIEAGGDVDQDEPGDVLVASEPGVAVSVLTADCVPVMLLGEDKVAAVHAGWRGIVAGAIEKGIAAVETPKAAWIGPSIHACCYEVGPDVVSAFEERNLPIADSWHVDPARAAYVALKRAGVERIAAAPDCTSCNPRYFSYRRDGTTGRQSGLVALL